MTTSLSHGGLAIARTLAEAYQTHPDVRAVMVSGSVARGSADRYSDLELGVFWEHPPSDADRTAAVAHMSGNLWSLTSYQMEPELVVNDHVGLTAIVIDNKTYHGTLMVSVNHLTCDAMERCLSDVLDDEDTAIAKQTLIAAVQDGIALAGAPLLNAWQTRAQQYPERLAIKFIQENLWCGPWCVPHAYAERDDTLVLGQHLIIWMQQSILKILAGLNHVYYRSDEHKWFAPMIDRCTLAPPNLARRMQQVFREEPMQGVAQMLTLIRETILLVEAHLPAVNLTPLASGLAHVTTTWALQRWESTPPYTLMEVVAAGQSR